MSAILTNQPGKAGQAQDVNQETRKSQGAEGQLGNVQPHEPRCAKTATTMSCSSILVLSPKNFGTWAMSGTCHRFQTIKMDTQQWWQMDKSGEHSRIMLPILHEMKQAM